MKRLLMVAYHFPPLAGSSGIQRTLRFAQHLPALGWEPLVLTCTTGAYESINADLLTEIPADMVVRRAGALDTARHLALGGRYLSALARPDRWMTWRFDGVRQGLQLIRQFQPAAIWSTYPIATAHVIGAALQRHSGLPWVADFRDPMAQEGYPEDPRTWQAFHIIESQAMRQAAVSTFTTPSAVRSYRQRYPDAAGRIVLLENGYDEGSFEAAEKAANQRAPLEPGGLTLLHSGIVYPSERNPTHLIAALRLLHDAGHIQPGRLRLRFRAPVHETLLNELAQRFGVQDYVETCAPVGYREALSEMLRADALAGAVCELLPVDDLLVGRIRHLLPADALRHHAARRDLELAAGWTEPENQCCRRARLRRLDRARHRFRARGLEKAT